MLSLPGHHDHVQPDVCVSTARTRRSSRVSHGATVTVMCMVLLVYAPNAASAACTVPSLENGDTTPCSDAPGSYELASGESCTPTCVDGYKLSGGTNYTCTADVLSPLTLTCEKVTCVGSIPPANGTVGDCPAAIEPYAQCTRECDPGFTLDGTSYCFHTGALWDGLCYENCKLEAPENGKLGDCPVDFSPGGSGSDPNICQPTCDEGYHVLKNYSCDASGDRSSGYKVTTVQQALCAKQCDMTELPENVIQGNCPDFLWQSGLEYGSSDTSCYLGCAEGFQALDYDGHPRTEIYTVCNSTGQYTPPSCQPKPKDCALESTWSPTNGRWGGYDGEECPNYNKWASTPYLSHNRSCDTVGCDLGYVKSGELLCNNGTLSLPTCIPQCELYPYPPKNGNFGTCNSSWLVSGSTCKIECDAGFVASGNTTCSVDGVLIEARCDAVVEPEPTATPLPSTTPNATAPAPAPSPSPGSTTDSQLIAAMEQAEASKNSMLSGITDPDTRKLATILADAALAGVTVTKLKMSIAAESSDAACDAAFTVMDIDADLGACESSAPSRRRHLTNAAFDVSVFIASETAKEKAIENLQTAGLDVTTTEEDPIAILKTIPEIEPEALQTFETDAKVYVDAKDADEFEPTASVAQQDATFALSILSALIAAAPVFA